MGLGNSKQWEFKEGWLYNITYNKGWTNLTKVEDAYTLYLGKQKNGSHIFLYFDAKEFQDTYKLDVDEIKGINKKQVEGYTGLRKNHNTLYEKWFEGQDDPPWLVLYDSEIITVTPGWDVKEKDILPDVEERSWTRRYVKPYKCPNKKPLKF